MNVKTTLVLLALLGAGAAGWYFLAPSTVTVTSKTLDFLDKDLTKDALTRIELDKAGQRRFLLERTGNDWSLSGKWPVRLPETDELLGTLTTLRSRFTPIPIAADTDLKQYGLDESALKVKVQVAGKEHTLTLGEEPATVNRFNRATYLRLDNEPEVVRLGPGLVAALDRPQDHFQQRRLFLAVRVAKDEDSKEKVEQVQAQEIRVESPDGKVTLVKKDNDWTITEPVADRTDPEKVKSLLAGLPDFWAERFVDIKGKKPADFGLDKPEYTFSVTRPGGGSVKVLVGKISDTKEKVVMKPGPPGQFGMPSKPMPQFIREEYRYAKLDANDQVFEVKTDKLKDVALKLDELRDPQVARFKSDDVRRIEIRRGKSAVLVLAKDKDKWRLERQELDAENQPVTELLDKLSGLQARDKDVRDAADPKSIGLEQPLAVVKLSLEEGKTDSDKKKRELTYQLGTSDKEKGKLFVKVEGWPRVNVVEDALVKLVERPALAYRIRKALDVAQADVSRIDIARPGETYTLEKKDNEWKLTEPIAAKADTSKADQLVGDLARLEAVEFVTPEKGKEAEADKLYGLDEAKLTATLHFTDAKKPPQTLVVGKQRAGKDDSYARVDKGPVFVVKKDVRELLERESLAYRPLQLWQVSAGDVQEIKVQKDGKDYTLVRKDKVWEIKGPFDAKAVESAVEGILDEAAQLKGEKFVAHAAKDAAQFGFDKPFVTVEVVAKGEKETKTHKVKVGKPVEKDEKNRYAQVEGDPAVFSLSEKVATALAKDALDLLDKDLVNVGLKSIQRIQTKGTTPFTLEQKKDEWRVGSAAAPEFTAEEDAVQSFLRPWSRLRAERIAAYGPKIDWKEFGLDNPSTLVTATVAAETEKDKPAKTTEHTLALGKEAKDGQRYARLDQQPAVVVLDAGTSSDLAKSHLDFVNHRVLKYDLDTVTGLGRQMKDGDLELVKRDDNWRFAKPGEKPADDVTVGDVLEKTFRLRAQRIAAYPAKDLKPFGLEQPAAVVTLKLMDATGAPSQHVIKIGDLAQQPNKKNEGERYALIDKGESVVVLGPELSKHLTAPVLHFADRNIGGFLAPDRVVLERGPRKLTFTKSATTWQMTAPVKADAEDTALEDFLKGLSRLRVDEVVAEKGDLKQYGLDRPAAEWVLFTGDKEDVKLLVGNPEPGKKDAEARRYAKLSNKDAIFFFSAKQSAKALDEYRSRKPWPTFDAVQVEKLSYQGPTPFTLEKKDNVWHVAGQPALKVNAKTVSDTLDALAGLKVERWLADEKGDLQLHGLQPPQWTIEATLPSGKRTLLVGRAEGDSQRLYAAAEGETAIFVIGADDAKRVVRAMAAFVDAK